MKNRALKTIKDNLEEEIIRDLDRIGVYYRIHSRTKTLESLQQKILTKGEGYYRTEGKKVQDMIGFRITTYFLDDVNLLWNYFSMKYEIVDKQYDLPTSDVFKPLRKNLICRFSADNSAIFDGAKLSGHELELVDSTYEVQFRTTSSEGWHEVDHALRYKCKNDWVPYRDEDKMFNGIYATLETTDSAMKSLFEDMAYNHYKSKNWEAMLRMKFFLKFDNEELSEPVKKLLNTNHELAKNIFKCSRA
ncbi:MAG TPA: RelA/SpoT domain-containing protein, partial [Paludibacteraceae bacterium]|nr:RelA/SpoT domain-containing protein [Paludibacteraceae bacterium]